MVIGASGVVRRFYGQQGLCCYTSWLLVYHHVETIVVPVLQYYVNAMIKFLTEMYASLAFSYQSM